MYSFYCMANGQRAAVNQGGVSTPDPPPGTCPFHHILPCFTYNSSENLLTKGRVLKTLERRNALPSAEISVMENFPQEHRPVLQRRLSIFCSDYSSFPPDRIMNAFFWDFHCENLVRFLELNSEKVFTSSHAHPYSASSSSSQLPPTCPYWFMAPAVANLVSCDSPQALVSPDSGVAALQPQLLTDLRTLNDSMYPANNFKIGMLISKIFTF